MNDSSSPVPLRRADPLADAHRVIRRLDAADSAFAGLLVADGERVGVRCAADQLDARLWRYAAADHIAGVRDVIRTPDGLDVLLPWCTDPVPRYLARRGDSSLSPGETVTLLGSMLRALTESAGEALCGRWWLTDDRRPLFVPGDGPTCVSGVRETAETLLHTCQDRSLRQLLEEVISLGDEPREWPRQLQRWEGELTELAAPRPLQEVRSNDAAAAFESAEFESAASRSLAAEAAAPRRARPATRAERRIGETAVSARTRHRALRTRSRALRTPALPGQRRYWDSARGLLRKITRPATRRRTSAVGPGPSRAHSAKGVSSTHAPRGRIALVGAAAAAAVLIGGLLWSPQPPSSSASGAAAEVVSDESAPQNDVSASDLAAEEMDASAERVAPGDDDPLTGARSAIDRLSACVEQGECDESAATDPLPQEWKRALRAGEAELALVEDYGDVALIRASRGAEETDQMLVIERRDDEWLVRDVYDVANQPFRG